MVGFAAAVPPASVSRMSFNFQITLLLLLLFPRLHLGSECVANLVAGSNGCNFFVVPVHFLEEPSPGFPDGADYLFGHSHLFLFGVRGIVDIGIIV